MKDIDLINKDKKISPLLPSKNLKEISPVTKKDLEIFLPGVFK